MLKKVLSAGRGGARFNPIAGEEGAGQSLSPKPPDLHSELQISQGSTERPILKEQKAEKAATLPGVL